ncbi:trehalose-phosphatase [Novosphingobium gossypii]|uniref:trehalose-phosphatase n=1 Tax=Novosphingobium gossypii TaxID=1604774 RepID=UPI003D25CCC2
MTNPSDGPSDGQYPVFHSVDDLPTPPALAIGPGTALFLDFDGTLVDIADHPDAVVVPDDLPDLLSGLSRALKGRLAVVTGRSIAALEGLVGTLDVAVAGSHGGEFRPSADAGVQPLAEPLPGEVVATLERCARDNGGLLVEPKPFSVAVHYRHHPEALEPLLACAEELGARFGLSLKHGKQVIELAMPGSDKGSAVTQFMGLPAFRGAVPLFLGDDVTDEDAFRAARALGGHGVLVGPMRATAATYRLPDVAHVRGWLKAGFDTAIKGDIHA